MKKFIILIIAYMLFINSPYVSLFAVSDGAYVSSFEGKVTVVKAGSKVGVPCKTNMGLNPGDWVSTGANSKIDVGYVAKTAYMSQVGANSLIEIKDGTPEWIEVYNGKILTRLVSIPRGETFAIRTPSGVCGARGTAWVLTTNGNVTNVDAFEHNVFFQGLNLDGSLMDEVVIEEGYGRKVLRYEAPGKMYKISKTELDKMWETANSFPVIGKLERDITDVGGVGKNVKK